MGVLDRLRLDGKTIIMTGAGRGLGRAMALDLAEAGADLVAAARTTAQIEETARDDPGHRPTLSGRTGEYHRFQARWGRWLRPAWLSSARIDVLVNNAGGASRGWNKPLEDITDEEWHKRH